MKSEKLEYCKLDELGRISRGRSQHRPRNAPYLYGGSIPFIQTADITRSNLYITEYTQTYTQLGLDQSRLWKQGVLCIVNAGVNTGDTAILNFDACFPDSIIGFIANSNKCNVKFIKYYLDSIKQQIRSITMGATQDNLSVAKLLTFPIPKITLESQNKIAAVISAYDDLIENNKRRIELLEKMAEEIYREWFVRFRFPGWETAEFEKGIPKDWVKSNISDFISFKSGFSFKSEKYDTSGKYGIVTIKNVHNGRFIEYCSDYISELPSNLPNHCFIKEGDILMSLTGNVGRVCIASGCDLLLNQRVVKLQSQKENSIYYIYWLFRQSSMQTFCEMIATGTAQQNLSPIKLGAQQLIFPDMKLTIKFQKIVSPIMDEIIVLTNAIVKLNDIKNALLPRLISGKLSVEELDIQFPPSMQEDLTVE